MVNRIDRGEFLTSSTMTNGLPTRELKNLGHEFAQIFDSLKLTERRGSLGEKSVSGFTDLIQTQMQIHDQVLKINLCSRVCDAVSSTVRRLQQQN